jgi:hypothetical protein
LERVLFALAGAMTLIAAALGAFVSKWFLLLAVLVGVNQWLYVLVGACRHRSCCAAPAVCSRRSTPTPPTTASAQRRARLVRR